MAFTTKRQLAESIRLRIYGGVPSVDAPITLQQIGLEINKAAAEVVKKSFYENSNVEGINYANDEFAYNITGNAVVKDATSHAYYTVLPSVPVGLPKGRGIRGVYAPQGYRATYVMIPAGEIDSYANTPRNPSWVYCWLDTGRIWFLPGNTIPTPTVTIKMIGQSGNNLDDEMYLTLDGQSEVQEIVYKRLLPVANTGIDKLNDGTSIRDAQ